MRLATGEILGAVVLLVLVVGTAAWFYQGWQIRSRSERLDPWIDAWYDV